MARKPQPTQSKPQPRAEKPDNTRTVVATNRRAHFEYHLLERFEAGLKLTGGEVKTLREGHCEISDAYAIVEKDADRAWLLNLQIPEWRFSSEIDRHEPKRKRALLLHRREIDKIREALGEQGLTLIPLSVYFRNGFAKVELAVCKGKKLWDKRESIKERDDKRRAERRVAR